MFINLTARNSKGDFYITSSEVEREKFGEQLIADNELLEHMMWLAHCWVLQGFDVTIKQEEL